MKLKLTPEQRRFKRELARDVAKFHREASEHLDRTVGKMAQTSTVMLKVLDLLRRVHPKHRTYDDLFWWFVTSDKLCTGPDLKAALAELKLKSLVRYDDPTGWVATA